MNSHTRSIGLGGGCHWCTEAVFQSLKGVIEVAQGYIAANPPDDSFSEGVLIYYDPKIISLDLLIEIHLHTHKSTALHSMRDTYRSAVYALKEKDYIDAQWIVFRLQNDFNEPLVTQVLHFKDFKASREEITNYYQKGPEKPFCERYIAPKLSFLLENYQEALRDV